MLTPGVGGAPQVAGAKYQRALESAAIGLNVSKRNDVFLYSSDRLAQLAGNGLAVLIDRATGYESLLAEGEFVYFSSLDELLDKLARLTGDSAYRRRVAAGRPGSLRRTVQRARRRPLYRRCRLRSLRTAGDRHGQASTRSDSARPSRARRDRRKSGYASRRTGPPATSERRTP